MQWLALLHKGRLLEVRKAASPIQEPSAASLPSLLSGCPASPLAIWTCVTIPHEDVESCAEEKRHLCMVVRHGGEKVVTDVGVSNVVEHMVQEAVGAVHRGQGTAQPLPLLVVVVRQGGVRVLQQRDHDQPHVDNQVRGDVHLRGAQLCFR